MRRLFAPLLGLLSFVPALPALAQREPYPSLLPRPVETRDRDAEAATEASEATANPAPVAADPALAAEVATLAARAAEAAAAFDRIYDEGSRSADAAAASSPGSEQWVTAQRWISALQSNRYGSVAALATLDTLYAGRANGDDPAQAAADVAAIAGARAAVVAMVDSQNDRLDALSLRLASR